MFTTANEYLNENLTKVNFLSMLLTLLIYYWYSSCTELFVKVNNCSSWTIAFNNTTAISHLCHQGRKPKQKYKKTSFAYRVPKFNVILHYYS